MVSLAVINSYKGLAMKNILLLLDEYRLKNKLTQQKLAELLGVSFVSVNRWLNGHAKPQKLQIYQIEKLLDKRK